MIKNQMKIKSIEFAVEVKDEYIDNIDVFVESWDGYTYTVVVSTPQDLAEEMDQENTNFVQPTAMTIIVKRLTKEIVREAIEAYAKNDGYWLKLCQFSDSIDVSILDKLQADHRKELE